MAKVNKNTQSSKSFFLKVLILSLFVFTFWFYINNVNKKQSSFVVVESSAQLSSKTESYSGMGTASKSRTTNKRTKEAMSEVNITAFLDKPAKGLAFYVVLKGEGLSDKFLGEMKLSGDVFSLNYITPDDLAGYKEVVVVKETSSNIEKSKYETVILSGTFK